MGILKGKNIVITGSGRGIGKYLAIACAREGANVGLTARTLEELNAVKKEIEELGTGVKVVGISIPTRYGHSPNSIISKTDLSACHELLTEFIKLPLEL